MWAMDSAGKSGSTLRSRGQQLPVLHQLLRRHQQPVEVRPIYQQLTLGVVGGWSGELRDTSTAIDSLGNSHITFYDVTNADLKYAALSSGAWSVATLDSAGDVGQYSSIELTSAGVVLVSYYNATNGDLKLAQLSGGKTTIELVDSIGQVGMYTSLALDSTGNPHISYYDASNGDLKYASGVPVVTQLFLPLILQNFSAP
jgi:hypothetical protein